MEIKRIVFKCSAGAGTTSAEAYEVPVDVTDEQLDAFAWELAVNNAETFGIYEPSFDSDCDEEDEEEEQHDWDQVEGHWEVYNSNKHDGILMYGNQTEVAWNVWH